LAEIPEKEPEIERLSRDTQFDKERAVLKRRSGRMPAIVMCSLALAVIGAVATYALPEFNIALPNFSSFPGLFRRDTGAPLPGSDVSAALKDIQSAQERNAAALQENGAALQQNTAMLQQGAAALESLRQGLTPSTAR
jgi:hypothetical protein